MLSNHVASQPVDVYLELHSISPVHFKHKIFFSIRQSERCNFIKDFDGNVAGRESHPHTLIKLNTRIKREIFLGGRHSSVVSSVPTILRPRVRIPSTPSTLFQFVLLKLYRENNENKQKEAGIDPFLKKERSF